MWQAVDLFCWIPMPGPALLVLVLMPATDGMKWALDKL